MIEVPHFTSFSKLFFHYVPAYKSYKYKPFIACFDWQPFIAKAVRNLAERRCNKRLSTYIIPGEMERPVSGKSRSIRFGYKKEGKDAFKIRERSDFCLVGGSFEKGKLTVFYRSVELIGGMVFDLAVFAEVERQLGPIKTVTIMATSAHVMALKRKHNPTL